MIPSAYYQFWDNFNWELYQRIMKAKMGDITPDKV